MKLHDSDLNKVFDITDSEALSHAIYFLIIQVTIEEVSHDIFHENNNLDIKFVNTDGFAKGVNDSCYAISLHNLTRFNFYIYIAVVLRELCSDYLNVSSDCSDCICIYCKKHDRSKQERKSNLNFIDLLSNKDLGLEHNLRKDLLSIVRLIRGSIAEWVNSSIAHNNHNRYKSDPPQFIQIKFYSIVLWSILSHCYSKTINDLSTCLVEIFKSPIKVEYANPGDYITSPPASNRVWEIQMTTDKLISKENLYPIRTLVDKKFDWDKFKGSNDLEREDALIEYLQVLAKGSNGRVYK